MKTLLVIFAVVALLSGCSRLRVSANDIARAQEFCATHRGIDYIVPEDTSNFAAVVCADGLVAKLSRIWAE